MLLKSPEYVEMYNISAHTLLAKISYNGVTRRECSDSNSIYYKMYISLWIFDRGVLNKCSNPSIVYNDNSRMCFGDSWPLLR